MEILKTTPKGKSAGTFAVLSTIFLLVAGIAYLNVPYEQKLIIFSESYFSSFLYQPQPYFFFWTDMFAHAMLMIGVISCFKHIDTRLNNTFFSWVSTLAIIGYTLMGLTYISRLYYMPNIANAFLNGTSATKDTIVALGTMEFDKFIMSYSFAALWFFTVGIASIKYKLFNKLLIIMSFINGAGYIVGLVGYLIRERALTTASSCLVVCFPVWAVSLLFSFKKASTADSEASTGKKKYGKAV